MPRRIDVKRFFRYDQDIEKYVCLVHGCIFRTSFYKKTTVHLIEQHRELVYRANRTHKIEAHLWNHLGDFVKAISDYKVPDAEKTLSDPEQKNAQR